MYCFGLSTVNQIMEFQSYMLSVISYSPVSDRRRRQHRRLLQHSLSAARVPVRGKLDALGKVCDQIQMGSSSVALSAFYLNGSDAGKFYFRKPWSWGSRRKIYGTHQIESIVVFYRHISAKKWQLIASPFSYHTMCCVTKLQYQLRSTYFHITEVYSPPMQYQYAL